MRVIHADCLVALPQLLADGVQFDAVVCDPPYGLSFMGKAWDAAENVAFRSETWAAVLAVMKPGAHLIAFSGTRTYHRMACAIEDAGFEIRDQLGWLYGSGFPKSHDISKGIDKANGDERPVFGRGVSGKTSLMGGLAGSSGESGHELTAPASPTSAAWQGWGTALKPAWEPMVLARKPFKGTVAANVLAHGTGGLNIDGCRVESDAPVQSAAGRAGFGSARDDAYQVGDGRTYANTLGRWPANIIHDGSDEVLAAFPETGASSDAPRNNSAAYGMLHEGRQKQGGTPFVGAGHADAGGSAARFFYSAKADAGDRLGSKHPTVKPVDLMAYLLRLVTPPGGLVLDPFAGSGTTGMAAMREGFDAVLIEREAEYVADIKRRIAHVSGEDAPLFAGATA